MIREPSDPSVPPFLSIVLSFYNEAAVIPELLRRLRVVLKNETASGSIGGYELIFVNDRSTDDSEKILRQEIDAGGDVVLVNMSRNFGNSECYFAGMRVAKGDAIVYMDADLQDPPELIPELIAAWRSDREVEVVYTTRLSRAGEPLSKLLITKFGYRLINAISEVNLPVDSGDFKLLTRRAVEYLLQVEEQRPYLRGLVSWIGFKQAQVFYHRQGRFDGRKQTKFKFLGPRMVSSWLRALIPFSDVPLKISLFVGFFMSCFSALYLCVVLLQKLMGWYAPGWPAIMATMLLLGGFQFMVLGMVGLYVNTIFLEVKGRPNYIVDTIVRNVDGQVLSSKVNADLQLDVDECAARAP
jgi:glycosyltransferase involved in cell wall biosynthesis